MSSDTRERLATRTGTWAAAAREAMRRGDRAAAVEALALAARAALPAHRLSPREEARCYWLVREALAGLVRCPVGRWQVEGWKRLPRLSEAEERLVYTIARAA